MDLFDLNGKVALVTGAAVGLGKAMAVGLAEAGADIAIVSNRHSSEETEKEICKLNKKTVSFKADLNQEKEIERVVIETVQAFGKVDILVNNAGIMRRNPAVDYTRKDWDDVIQLNLNSVFFLCRIIGKKMLEQGYGKIINIASVASFQGGIYAPAYIASKHGVAGLTKALANEWASQGVHVNAIAPGYLKTEMTETLRQDENRNQEIMQRIPAQRWGTPDDLKGPVVFLASSASDYLHGHILCVDGGWMGR